MTDSNSLEVLLYADGTKQSLSAAAYTANLFYNIPNMHLTVLHVQANDVGPIEGDYNLMATWSSHPHLVKDADSEKRMQDSESITKTNKIFTERGHNVNHKVIYSNCNISDTVVEILRYATNYGVELIITGTRGLTGLKRLIHGSLAHSLLKKSNIPVLITQNSYVNETSVFMKLFNGYSIHQTQGI
ncbi:MAG TPA: universal stress protein [Desulfosporosinus sp.]|nr:universal stress protein [Desulfosporosinus sp.]